MSKMKFYYPNEKQVQVMGLYTYFLVLLIQN